MPDPKQIECESKEGNDESHQDFPDKRELKRIYEKEFKDIEYLEQYRVDTRELGKTVTIILNSRNCESFNGKTTRRFRRYFNDEARALKKGITPEKYIKKERTNKIRILRQQHDNNKKRLKNEMDRVIRGVKQLDKLIAGMEKNYLRIWQHEVRKKREKEFLILKSLKEKVRKTFSEMELKEYMEKIKKRAEKEHKPILEVEEEEARSREREGIKTRQFDDLERIEQEAFLKELFGKEIKNLELEVNDIDKSSEFETKVSRILEFDDTKMIGEVRSELDEI